MKIAAYFFSLLSVLTIMVSSAEAFVIQQSALGNALSPLVLKTADEVPADDSSGVCPPDGDGTDACPPPEPTIEDNVPDEPQLEDDIPDEPQPDEFIPDEPQADEILGDDQTE